MAISSFVPTCTRCKKRTDFTSRDITPPHKLAWKAGWRSSGRGWMCSDCYNLEHGLVEKSNEKFDTQSALQKIRASAAKLASRRVHNSSDPDVVVDN